MARTDILIELKARRVKLVTKELHGANQDEKLRELAIVQGAIQAIEAVRSGSSR